MSLREHAADDLVEFMALQVAWYRRNGKYPTRRIVRDPSGHEYVIGDWSWNRNHNNPAENIEPEMDRATARREVSDLKARLHELAIRQRAARLPLTDLVRHAAKMSLEEAARECDRMPLPMSYEQDRPQSHYCAARIRALAEGLDN